MNRQAQFQNAVIRFNAKLISHATGNQVVDSSGRAQRLFALKLQRLSANQHQLLRNRFVLAGKPRPGPIKIRSQPRRFDSIAGLNHNDVMRTFANYFKRTAADCLDLMN